MIQTRNIAVISIYFATFAACVNAQPDLERYETVMTFLSHRSGLNLLYNSQPDGSNPQIVFGGPIENVPSFSDSYKMIREPHWTRQSPNGKLFASWVYELGFPLEKHQSTPRAMLWVGSLDGTWTRTVNPDCYEEFAWSPDSRRLAFSVMSRHNYRGSLQKRPDTTEIFTSGIDGANCTCVFEKVGRWVVLDWSPDGKRLLLANREIGRRQEEAASVLFEFQIQDALEERSRNQFSSDWPEKSASKFLTQIDLNVGGMQCNEARYSPTRNELAIAAFNPQKMLAPNLVPDDELERGRMMRMLGKIYVHDRDAKSLKKVADYDDGIRGPICWSPDGNDIYFSRYLPKEDDREKMSEDKQHGLAIWGIGRDGTNARFVTTGWSPDFPRDSIESKK